MHGNTACAEKLIQAGANVCILDCFQFEFCGFMGVVLHLIELWMTFLVSDVDV